MDANSECQYLPILPRALSLLQSRDFNLSHHSCLKAQSSSPSRPITSRNGWDSIDGLDILVVIVDWVDLIPGEFIPGLNM